MRKHLGWLVIVVPLFLMILGNVIAWPHLGDRIPIHWNMNGDVDSWGGKGMIWLLPCLFLWTAFLLSIITLRLPGSPEDSNRNSVRWVQAGLGFLFIYLQSATLIVALGSQTRLAMTFIIGGFGVFLISLSWSFKTVKRNNLIGIRTKWTLASDENWEKTHRFGSTVLSIAGCLMALGPYFLNLKAAAGIFLAAVLAIIIYSYQLHKGSKAPPAS